MQPTTAIFTTGDWNNKLPYNRCLSDISHIQRVYRYIQQKKCWWYPVNNNHTNNNYHTNQTKAITVITIPVITTTPLRSTIITSSYQLEMKFYILYSRSKTLKSILQTILGINLKLYSTFKIPLNKIENISLHSLVKKLNMNQIN